MSKQGTLTVRVVSDTKGLEKGLDGTAKKVATTGDKFQAAGKKMTLFATVPVVAAMGFAANAASDLNETLSKSNTVFGKSAKTIENWADGAVDDFGQSKREALDAASSFGNMFVQLGIGADRAAEMSMQMTELASDFASFHNADITEVITAQSAAFRGEYDALQRFIPTINAATVEQKAMEQTGKAATKELTAQEKALAVQTIMLEQAGDAMGDFDRTSDSAANQTRKAKAAMEDAAAELGSSLLPIVAKGASAVADLAGAFGGLPDPIKTGIVALAGLLALSGPVMTAGGAIAARWALVSAAMDKVAISAYTASGSFKTLAATAAPFLAVAAAATTVTIAVNKYGDAMSDAASDGHAFAESFSSDFDASKASAEEFRGEMNRLGDAHSELVDRANNALNPFLKERFLEAAEGIAVTRREMGTAWEAAGKLKDELGITGDEALQMALNQDTMSAAVDDATGELDAEAAAAEALEQQISDLKDATEELIGVHINAEEALIGVTGDFANLTATLEENGHTLDINTEKGRANREQIIRTTDGIFAHIEALAREGKTTAEVNWVLGAHIEQLRNTMKQAGLTDKEIDGYIDTLGLTPENIATLVQLNGVGLAEQQLNTLTRERVAEITARFSTSRSLMGGMFGGFSGFGGRRHSGGPVDKGTPYLVGRAGHEELFVPDQSGDILSGPKTDRLMAGTGGRSFMGGTSAMAPQVNITVQGSVYGDRRALMGEITQAVRDGIPLPRP